MATAKQNARMRLDDLVAAYRASGAFGETA